VGRPENPLSGSNPMTALAAELRELRSDPYFTLRELAKLTHYSIATLSSALSGKKLPSWNVTAAIVDACDGEPADYRRRWESAVQYCFGATEEPRASAAEFGIEHLGLDRAFLPTGVETTEQFMERIRLVKISAGDAPVRALARKAHVGATTMQDFLTNKNGVMPTMRMVVKFLMACGLPPGAISEWEHVWRRLKHRETEARLKERRHNNVVPLSRVHRV
jgi:transcriptional regulator with XRE-family HTH domain